MFAKAAAAIKQLPSEFKASALYMKFYAIGGVLFVAYLVIGFVLILFRHDARVQDVAEIIIPFVLISFTIGVVVEFVQRLSSVWHNLWFGFFVGFLTFIAYSMARMEANEFINTLTNIDPSKLPEAQNLLTSLLLLPSWIKLLLPILLVLLVIAMLVIPILAVRDKTTRSSWLAIVRLLGVMGVFVVFARADELYGHPLVEAGLRSAVVASEYHPRTICTNVFPGERVADVGDGFVSVFSTATDTFEPRRCERPQKAGS